VNKFIPPFMNTVSLASRIKLSLPARIRLSPPAWIRLSIPGFKSYFSLEDKIVSPRNAA
jgi:hypothetical protein